MKKIIGSCLVIIIFLFIGSSCADELSITCQIKGKSGTNINIVDVNGLKYLFLPSCARTEQLIINDDKSSKLCIYNTSGDCICIESGKAFCFSALFNSTSVENKYSLVVQNENGKDENIAIMISANIRTMFLHSDNPTKEGRAWIEDCDNHERSATGHVVLLRADGSVVFDGNLSAIRGRGNSTWLGEPPGGSAREDDYKRPYQIKLETKVDLLDTGDENEANKRWLLLADYYDSTLLRNRIALDLALELGLDETSHCQPVDLYYDGEYRGMYLLTEKVEIGTGRIEVIDYEKILEEWNVFDEVNSQKHQQIKSNNKYDDTIYAVEGVEDSNATNLGGYLIELDNGYASQEKAYFTLQSDMLFAVKSPENASMAMVKYISELFEDFYTTITNGGVNPDNGVNWFCYIDSESLLPYYWINEWAKNSDIWRYSSTYFVLPENCSTLRMGPVWDFDFAFYPMTLYDGSVSDATGLIKTEGSMDAALLQIPSFQTLAKRYYNDVFEPVITQILLGDVNTQGTYLHSLAWYWQEEAASRDMNDVLWNPFSVFGRIAASTYEENYCNLRSYITDRTAWLKQETDCWINETTIDAIKITLTANYGNAAESLDAMADGINNALFDVSLNSVLIKAATKSDYALWCSDVNVKLNGGYHLADNASLFVNGTQIPYRKNLDNSITACVKFEDPSYRTAEYNNVDYGLTFNADYYIAHYPEIVADVGNDPDRLLSYYVENGIAEGQVANAFFNPKEIFDCLPDVAEMLGEDYEMITFFYLEAGYQDWMNRMGKIFKPVVTVYK